MNQEKFIILIIFFLLLILIFAFKKITNFDTASN